MDAYEDFKVDEPPRRRSTRLGWLLGIALGIGALQVAQVQSLIARVASAWKHRSAPAARVIEDEPAQSERWQPAP
ncbi:MAG TPA: hypothetical protein VKN99_24670 [Polyangia bacterium]|nr:hypothetical protein [Polyangia bacterium]